MENNFTAILSQIAGLKVLVIGEAIYDSSVRGEAGRLSLEAPVPVIDAGAPKDIPGGAANLAVNAARLGASVEMISVVGDDAEGKLLVDLLEKEGVETKRIIRDPARRTLLKRRVYAGEQMLVRYDQGTTSPVDEETARRLLADLGVLCKKADLVFLIDYGMGVLTDPVLDGLRRIQASRDCPLVVDTRRLEKFHGLRLLAVSSSQQSALELLDHSSPPAQNAGENGSSQGAAEPAEEKDLLQAAGECILSVLHTQVAVVTLDENGAWLFERDTHNHHTCAQSLPLNRVNGAGEAFLTGLGFGLAAGAPAVTAAEFASAVAAVSVRNGGAPVCCAEDFRVQLTGDTKLFEDWSELGARLDAYRQQGKRIVFTNGVFDILHSAHVSYLIEARSFGDVLVIGVNSDESVRRLKGPTRPINALIERMRVLAGLSCVDVVTCFSDDNPIQLIHAVRPDVYVKGGDYTRDSLPEAEVVEKYGGTLRLVDYIANHSTTGVIERIKERAAVSGQQTAVSGQQTADSSQRSAGSERQPAGRKQRAAVSGQQTAVSRQRAAAGGQEKAGSDQRTANSRKQPAVSRH